MRNRKRGLSMNRPPRGFDRPIDALLDLVLWASLSEDARKGLSLARRYQRERPQREAEWARKQAKWEALRARIDSALEAKRQADIQQLPQYKGLTDEERIALSERYPDFYRRLVAAHNRLAEIGRRKLAQEGQQQADRQRAGQKEG